ncbi:MAG: ABC-F family ATP-binding cassette domain-containing protein [Bacteroidales bacterium]|jgi:ATP-binding cassette, subfamily F, member 3|nr:ABC-F family ATP-binding cassette domain-containing protein [Bacteroidales bacterium]
MISISNISVSFAHKELFRDISLTIDRRDRIALVGKNGAGKTTLIKIIAGLAEPTSGRVVRSSGCRMGYLPQQMGHARDKSVLEEALTVFSYLEELHKRIDIITMELAGRDDFESESYKKLMVELNEVTDRLRILSSDNPRGNAEKILTGLGFKQDELDRPSRTFSEGWNMRIELAKLLLSRPDILLLDEPTNHLDIESLRWLEQYLETYPGALLVISHDRTFLDTVTNRTIEMSLNRIYDYKAPYSRFLELRREYLEQQMAAYQNQQRTIEKTQEFIERFRYKPTKSNQVQSRIRQLEKMELIEVDQLDYSQIRMSFPEVRRSGKVVFNCRNVSVGYDKGPVFSGANLVVERGEKVAFAGRNGEGKTTMLKLLTGQKTLMSGVFETGHNVQLGYYAQNQDELLDNNLTVYQTLDNIAVGEVRTRLRDILASFLFRGEEVDKKAGVLSGGERSRLALAKLMLQPYNVLALDEPTNHMDIPSREVMKEALKQYTGTLVVVSHDRTFLDGLVHKIYEFRDGKVKEHLGGIREFMERRKLETLRELDKSDPAKEEIIAESSGKDSRAGELYRQKKERDKTLRKLQLNIQHLENRIEQHEKGIALMDEKMLTTPPGGFNAAFYQLYEKEKKELDQAMKAWECAHNELETFIETTKND